MLGITENSIQAQNYTVNTEDTTRTVKHAVKKATYTGYSFKMPKSVKQVRRSTVKKQTNKVTTTEIKAREIVRTPAVKPRTYHPVPANITRTNRLIVCPNPADDIIQIKGWKDAETSITIFSSGGQRVLHQDKWNGEEIVVSELPAGHYSIRINNGPKIRFIKK